MEKKVWTIATCIAVICATCAFAGEISSRTFSGVRQAPAQSVQKKNHGNNYTNKNSSNNTTSAERPKRLAQQQVRVDMDQMLETAKRYVPCFEEARKQRRLAPLDEYTKNMESTYFFKTICNNLGSQELLCWDILNVEKVDRNYIREHVDAYAVSIWMKYILPNAWADHPFPYTDICQTLIFSASAPHTVLGVTDLCRIKGSNNFEPGELLKGKYVIVSDERAFYDRPEGKIILKILRQDRPDLIVSDLTRKVNGRTWYFVFKGSNPTIASNGPNKYGWGWVPVEDIAQDDTF